MELDPKKVEELQKQTSASMEQVKRALHDADGDPQRALSSLQAQKKKGNETFLRVISAVILLPIFVFCVTYTQWFFLQLLLMALLAMYLGLAEYFVLTDRGLEGRPFRGLSYTFAVLLVILYYFQMVNQQAKFPVPEFLKTASTIFYPGYDLIIPCYFVFFMLAFGLQIVKRPLDGAIFSVATSIVGILYMSIPIGHLLLVIGLKNGLFYIWFAAGITMISDGGAYFGGRWFGKNPAGLKISPKKTWEGYITGIIIGVIYTIGLFYAWQSVAGELAPIGILEGCFVAVVFAIITVLGDLSESAMKRDAKIKDSAATVPGMGGILDVIDAMLFTIPCIYFYVKIKESMGYTI
ncbi:MAG: phosphatidate cytidylyltransferase [Spirochaetota bacterium]